MVVAPEDFDNTINIQHKLDIPMQITDSLSLEVKLLLVLGMVSFIAMVTICFCCVYVYKVFKLSRFVSPTDLLLFVWNILSSPLRTLHDLRVSAEATTATSGIRIDETVRLDIIRAAFEHADVTDAESMV